MQLDFKSLARLSGTLVFLMGVSAIPEICQGLLEAGMEPQMPAADILPLTFQFPEKQIHARRRGKYQIMVRCKSF